MSRDIRAISGDLTGLDRLVRGIRWFRNVGRAHPRDPEVVRLQDWADWHGPEKGFGDWFGRYRAVVREHLEAAHAGRRAERDATWRQFDPLVRDLAGPNVPADWADRDPWYGPTAAVWGAGYTAALVACHVLVGSPLPDPIADQWGWLADGHWPCDYAEEPPGYRDESAVDVPAGRLVVY